jgi:hypothetical protein
LQELQSIYSCRNPKVQFDRECIFCNFNAYSAGNTQSVLTNCITFHSKPRQKTCQQQISVRKPKFQSKFAVALWWSGWLCNTWHVKKVGPKTCLSCPQPLQHSGSGTTDVRGSVQAVSPKQCRKGKEKQSNFCILRRLTIDKPVFVFTKVSCAWRGPSPHGHYSIDRQEKRF